VTLGLAEIVVDRLELGVIERETVGELERTEPAPTVTNEIFVVCNHDAVMGSVSPSV